MSDLFLQRANTELLHFWIQAGTFWIRLKHTNSTEYRRRATNKGYFHYWLIVSGYETSGNMKINMHLSAPDSEHNQCLALSDKCYKTPRSSVYNHLKPRKAVNFWLITAWNNQLIVSAFLIISLVDRETNKTAKIVNWFIIFLCVAHVNTISWFQKLLVDELRAFYFR